MQFLRSSRLNISILFFRLTTVIFDHLDRCDERLLKARLEEQEDDQFEEEEQESDDDTSAMDEESHAMDDGQKSLLRQEFVSTMYSTYVCGKDDAVNYKYVWLAGHKSYTYLFTLSLIVNMRIIAVSFCPQTVDYMNLTEYTLASSIF